MHTECCLSCHHHNIEDDAPVSVVSSVKNVQIAILSDRTHIFMVLNYVPHNTKTLNYYFDHVRTYN